jgi:protein kinase-like protein
MEDDTFGSTSIHDGDSRLGNGSASSDCLEELVEAWWSRYCPTCKSRHSLSETTCPSDGTSLRDFSVSITQAMLDDTAFPGTTGDFSPPQAPDHPPGHAESSGNGSRRHGLPQVLGGKWRVGERRGGGTFGSFFVGSHHILGMQVGIKVLRRRLNSTSTWRLRFHQEAQRVSCLNHPNIVKVFDYGEEESRPYLVMEYLTGAPLSTFILDHALSLEDHVEIVRQTAVALSAAHQGLGIGKPLIHLDLKPEHIFIEKIHDQWHVKVIDFGIAEIASSPGSDDAEAGSSESRRVTGTLPYMAPERWAYVVDPRCDIYSLGIILYELVGGRTPFRAEGFSAMRKLHETATPSPPSSHRSGPRSAALRELDALILSCLEKDPSRRPQTAQDLVKALEEWQARPRLSAAQRVRRAAKVPLVTLFLAMIVLYWAPWESIDPRWPRTESKALVFDPVVVGLGYQGCRASLMVACPATGKEVEIDLTTLEELRFQVRFDSLRGATPSLANARQVKARFRIHGNLGRTITSHRIELLLDDLPPMLESGPVGQVEVFTEGDDRTQLWLLGPKPTLTFIASEPLDQKSSLLNDLPGLLSLDRKSVTFKVDPQSRKLQLALTDLAGNSRELTWDDVRWTDPPRLVSETRIFIRESPYDLPLKVAGDCKRLTANGKELEPVGQVDGLTLFSYHLDFLPTDGPKQEVTVQLWSTLAEKKGSPCDQKQTVVVEHNRRELKIKEELSPDAEEVFPSGFQVVDAAGDRIASEEIVIWNARFLLYDGRKLISDQGVEIGSGKFDPGDVKRLQGCVITLIVDAHDKFGNQGTWNKIYHDFAQAPVIAEMHLVEGSPGTKERPLLNADCPLRKNGMNSCRLDLVAKVEWPFEREDLALELRVGNAEGVGQVVNVELAEDGHCAFAQEQDEEKFLRFLKPGPNPNDVYLMAYCRKSRAVSNRARVKVYYDHPANLEIEPSAGAIVGDSVAIEVRRKGGPVMNKISVSSGGKPVYEAPAHTPHQVKLDVGWCGPVKLELVMEFKEGWKETRVLEFARKPAKRKSYVYSFSEAEEVAFQHFAPGLVTFWISEPSAWRSLVTRFRQSPYGKKFDGPSEDGVSFKEAQAIARWLTMNGRESHLLKDTESFKLPLFEQLRAILPQFEPDDQWPAEEWLEGIPTDLEGKDQFKAARTERKSGGLIPLGAVPEHPYPFRLILEVEDGSSLNPTRAISAHEVGKETSK